MISNKERIMNETQIETLIEQGYTKGLAKALGTNCDVFPIRFWVVDNSYSMTTKDGHRIVQDSVGGVRTYPCSRYDEIKECVNYHAHMANLLNARTEFRFLNDPQVIPQRLTVGSDGIKYDRKEFKAMLDMTRPNGLTPLTEHVIDLQRTVKEMAPNLMKEGQKAVIVLATDGLPVENSRSSREQCRKNFVNVMRSLEGLPVWIVIRLCTDEDEVVDFYNDLDEQLELSLEVLDDFEAEAKEVYEHNEWLNYGLPIHRMREQGFHDRVFDLIDERPLTKGELRQFLKLLLGEENFDGVPDPSVDWEGFMADIQRLLQNESKSWNPIKKRVMPLIDMLTLNRIYGPQLGGCNCSIM